MLISSGEFSGVRPALLAALKRAQCDVVYARQTLRELRWRRPWHLARMITSALLVYRGRARPLLYRTKAAFVARSRVCKAIVDRHPDADVILLIGANSDSYWGERTSSLQQHVVYTDYMNLLSKMLPGREYALMEQSTTPRWNELERQALRAQDHIFVMGGHVKPAIASAYNITDANITVVGAGPDVDLNIERDGGRKHASGRRVLFVGKLGERKGLGVLMRAFEQVLDVFPDAELHVVTRTAVAGPGVVFHGAPSLPELRDLFYSANIFAMPAFKEPLGLVFLEAMLSKNACIGTTAGSMPELIADGETGYLIKPGDVDALANRLIQMMRDPEKTRLMGEAGFQRAREYWDWDGVVRRMLHVLEETRNSRVGNADFR